MYLRIPVEADVQERGGLENECCNKHSHPSGLEVAGVLSLLCHYVISFSPIYHQVFLTPSYH